MDDICSLVRRDLRFLITRWSTVTFVKTDPHFRQKLSVKFNIFLFQNNARGGYNVGDKTNSRANNEGNQYRMVGILYFNCLVVILS